jgi:uncharacterized protein (DUF302 family)
MPYGRTVLVDEPVTQAVERVKAALKEQGFGTLTEIDIQATLKEKLDADVEPYVILGACNPRLAHRALQAEPDVGLLLPCNVVVRTHGERTMVSAVDPQMIADFMDHPELRGIAEEATELLDRALASLAA